MKKLIISLIILFVSINIYATINIKKVNVMTKSEVIKKYSINISTSNIKR